jgi:transposase
MTQNLSKLITSTSNAKLRMRLLAVAHFIDGKNRTQISGFLKVSRTSVNKWIKTYLSTGLAGLEEKKRTGRRKCLTEKQLVKLKAYIVNHTLKADNTKLLGKQVQTYIRVEFNVCYQKTHIYHLLDKFKRQSLKDDSDKPIIKTAPE